MAHHEIDMRPAGVMTRRVFLRTIGMAAGSLVVAAHLPNRQLLAGQTDAGEFQLKAAEPNPKYGGTLRYGILSAPAHFDVHQSGTVSNMAAQGPMYDNLIRRDPRDGQTIIPDLAIVGHLPGRQDLYLLSAPGVKFHDGADFTAEDVHATFSRIIWPPKGRQYAAHALFSAVSEIKIIDPYTIAFHLSEPRPNELYARARLPAAGTSSSARRPWRRTITTCVMSRISQAPGPFRHVRRVDKEVWIMEKNPDYWNKGLPYLDRLEVYHIPPWTPEVAAALLGGKVDYARTIDPVAGGKSNRRRA